MVRDGGHDPQAPMGSAASYLCLGPGFSSACNTPHRRHKTWVHEGGISTPLVAHWPAGIAARGELRQTPTHLVDIVPTLLELAGATKPKEWQGQPIPPAPGKSLVPALTHDVVIARESLWWLHEGNKAIRVGDWKLVAAKDQPWALYDLRTDRAEQNDLSAKMPDKAKELADLWQKQTDETIALVKLTQDEQPRGKAKAAGKKGK
jgi:arylsulfatase